MQFAKKNEIKHEASRSPLIALAGRLGSLGERSLFAFGLPSLASLICAALCLTYAYLFYQSIAPYWFHPSWTTDDSLQQVYPFHEVLNPDIFKGDLITEVMRGYLAPLHYWMGYGITKLTGDPIMMSHWMMLIQVVLSLGFLFLAVRHLAGNAPAFFAVMWFLHTRHIMQRLTAGLPRGWAAPVFTAYLYCVVSGKHNAVLLTLLAGCLLHPPACLLIAISYGLLLVLRVVNPATRDQNIKPLLRLALLSPIFMIITWQVVKRPEYIGQMVSYQEAASMPEFQVPKGRFPFVPLNPAWQEIRIFGTQAFIGRFFNPGRFWKANMVYFIGAGLAGLLIAGLLRRRKIIPDTLLTFFIGTLAVYFASRAFAFKLYVPNRHLQFPLGIFLITAFSVGAWRAFHRSTVAWNAKEPNYADSSLRKSWTSALALVAVGTLVYLGSGLGLKGAANFNWTQDKNGHVFSWIKENAPRNALFAGHPTYIDPLQLYGMRKAFVSTETSHPFYSNYNKEMRRRLEIVLRAHYAKSLQELVSIVEPEGIDFFIFERKQFYPRVLKEAFYFPPLDALVTQLTSGDPANFAYRELPETVDLAKYPFMPFKDNRAVLVDIAKLRDYLATVNNDSVKKDTAKKQL